MQMQTFIGREDALNTLSNAWSEALSGSSRLVVLEGPDGSGRAALVSQLLTRVQSGQIPPLAPQETPADGPKPGAQHPNQPMALRLSFAEGEDGLKVLLRLFAGLYNSLHDDATLKASVSNHVEKLLETAPEPQKMWLTAFREGMDKPRPDTSASSFQVTIPRQSPFLALQEILASIAPVHPILLDLNDVDHVLSFTFWTFLTALTDRTRFQKLPLFIVMGGLPSTEEERKAVPFSPRHTFLSAIHPHFTVVNQVIGELSEAELVAVAGAQYASHRLPAAFLRQLAALAHGIPGRMTGLLALAQDRDLITQADDDAWVLSTASTDVSLEDLMPDLPTGKEGLARQMLQVAALEGPIFTASLISEQLSTEKDTVDDLLDDLEDYVEEVIHHEGLQSWLYRFKQPVLRNLMLEELSAPARKELSRGIAELLEKKYVNAAPDYAVKAARLWRDVGEPRRTMSLMGLAASAERPEVLQMGAELVKAFPETVFAPSFYKGLHLTLFEKLVPVGPVEPLMVLLNDVEKWATDQKDDELMPWVALYKGRIYHRVGNLKEAQTEAEKAQKAFARTENAVKEADALNVLGMVALAKGELGIANDHASRAIAKTNFPPIRVQSTFIKGLVFKGRGDLQQAVNNLKEALEMSGRLGQLPLHLDSGLNIGECLLIGGKPDEAVTLLKQLLEVARQTNQKARERAALSLLAKAEATLRDLQSAADYASQALKISRDLKIRSFEGADLLDLGIFSFVRGSLDESSVYLREAEKIARDINDARMLKEISFHHGMVFTGLKDYTRAHKAYSEALTLARSSKDERREANILFNVGGLYLHQGEFARAKTFLDQATPLIEKFGSPDEQKALKKAQEQLETRIN